MIYDQGEGKKSGLRRGRRTEEEKKGFYLSAP